MTRPHILVFHCHDLGQHLYCYGIRTVQTPNIDRLASEGVLFRKSFCVAPQCSPSRAAMFTGRYPHSNGVMGLTHARFAWDLHPEEKHLAQLLQAAGYETYSIGVRHESHAAPHQIGFDHAIPGNRADAVVDKIIAQFQTHASQPDRAPFFISAGTIEPHRLPAPDEKGFMGFLGDYMQPDDSLGVTIPDYLRDDHDGTRKEMAQVQGAIKYVDDQFGRVMHSLEETGLLDNTIVVFTADHGIAMPRAKCSCYDPGLEIPLIVRWPARQGWNGGRIFEEELIPNIDLTPSLLEAAGAPLPDNLHGKSWVPLIEGRDYLPHDAFFPELSYHDYYDPIRGIRTRTHKLLVFFTAAPSFMPPNQSWFPQSWTKTPADPGRAYHPDIELYDLVNDPWEQNNLSADAQHESLKRDLLRQLYAHLRRTRDPILQGAITPPAHENALDILRRA